MSQTKTISSALISVFSKNGLEPVVKKLNELGVTIYSTGGTQKFINDLDINIPIKVSRNSKYINGIRSVVGR